MAENDTMEGKDLAQEKKKEEKNRLLEVTKNLKIGQTTISTEGLEVTNYNGEFYTLKMRGITFGTFGSDGKPKYFNLIELKRVLKDEGIELESLDLPDLEQAIDQEELEQKQDEKVAREDNEGEQQQEEKDDEKPELDKEAEEEKDDKKEDLAKQYGIEASQVIHISKHKKITKEDFGQVAEWSREYDDIFIVPGEEESDRKFIGVRNGQQEEIEGMQKTIGGKNAMDITVKKMDDKEIKEVRPLSVHQIGGTNEAIAIIRDEYGKLQALRCVQEGGDKKAFWGNPIPEASGTHIEQQDLTTRSMTDPRITSSNDLIDKKDEYEDQKRLEKQGMPSKGPGVSPDEINKGKDQVREGRIEEIITELKRRDSIKKEIQNERKDDNYYKDRAEMILKSMESNSDMSFEEAIDKVEEEKKAEKKGREEGGRTPGDDAYERLFSR